MYPDIFSEEELAFVQKLMEDFRSVITENEPHLGFSIAELDEVISNFPDVDLTDSEPGVSDESYFILSNMFAFVHAGVPRPIVLQEDLDKVMKLWTKVRNA